MNFSLQNLWRESFWTNRVSQWAGLRSVSFHQQQDNWKGRERCSTTADSIFRGWVKGRKCTPLKTSARGWKKSNTQFGILTLWRILKFLPCGFTILCVLLKKFCCEGMTLCFILHVSDFHFQVHDLNNVIWQTQYYPTCEQQAHPESSPSKTLD